MLEATLPPPLLLRRNIAAFLFYEGPFPLKAAAPS